MGGVGVAGIFIASGLEEGGIVVGGSHILGAITYGGAIVGAGGAIATIGENDLPPKKWTHG